MKYFKIYCRFSIFISSASFIFANDTSGLLRIPIGAKSIALGGAYSANIRGPISIVWNPAGLAVGGYSQPIISNISSKFEQFEKEQEILTSSSPSTEATSSAVPSSTSLGVTRSKKFSLQSATSLSILGNNTEAIFSGVSYSSGWGAIGAAFLGNQVRKLRGYNDQGQVTEDFSTYTYAGFLGYSIELGAIRIGTSLSGFQESLYKSPIYGGGLDLGAQYVSSLFSVGLSVQNLVGLIQKSAEAKNTFRRLNTVIRLAGSLEIPKSPVKMYMGTSINIDNKAEGFKFNVGISYRIIKYTDICVGLNHTNITGGIYFHFPYVSTGYAVHKDLLGSNIQHHVDFILTF